MSLFLTMLPLYLLGNLHCVGMCGPLVALLGQHRFRYYYFAGRLLSFSLAGMAAGVLGAAVGLLLRSYYIPAATSFLFGGCIFLTGVCTLLGWRLPLGAFLSQRLRSFHNASSLLLLRDTAWTTFLFGFFTVLLPCGQTIVVFSACALAGAPEVGFFNGAAFALLTSPSLWLAMHARQCLAGFKRYERPLMGSLALFVGVLALLRGFAELELLPHLVINPSAPVAYHIVIY